MIVQYEPVRRQEDSRLLTNSVGGIYNAPSILLLADLHHLLPGEHNSGIAHNCIHYNYYFRPRLFREALKVFSELFEYFGMGSWEAQRNGG